MADNRRTEIGPDTLVVGNIDAQEDVSIHGRVDGTIRSTATVIIEDDGEVDGEIEALSVVVAGVLVGNIRATSKVEVEETGVVQGDIATPVMVLVDGGAVAGMLVMDDSNPQPVKVNTAGGTTYRPQATRQTGSTRPTASRTATRPSASVARTAPTSRGATSGTRARTAETPRTARQPRSGAPLIDDVEAPVESES